MPGKIPDRLASVLVATPLPFVVAVPTGLPLRVKLIVLPLIGDESAVLVRVAVRVTVPP